MSNHALRSLQAAISNCSSAFEALSNANMTSKGGNVEIKFAVPPPRSLQKVLHSSHDGSYTLANCTLNLVQVALSKARKQQAKRRK